MPLLTLAATYDTITSGNMIPVSLSEFAVLVQAGTGTGATNNDVATKSTQKRPSSRN